MALVPSRILLGSMLLLAGACGAEGEGDGTPGRETESLLAPPSDPVGGPASPTPLPTPAPTPIPTPRPTPIPILKLPDLVPTGVTMDSTYFYATASNQGTAASSALFTVTLKDLDDSESFESNYLYPFTVPAVGKSMQTGGYTPGLIGLALPCTPGHVFHIQETVDPRGAVTESNETNNTATFTLTCPAKAPVCPALSTTTCGIVSKMKPNGCASFWEADTIPKTLAACQSVMASDPNYAAPEICDNVYRNLGQFSDLNYERQFGTTVISSGTCPALSTYPACTSLNKVATKQFCTCPAGSLFPAALCDDGAATCTVQLMLATCEGA